MYKNQPIGAVMEVVKTQLEGVLLVYSLFDEWGTGGENELSN